MTIKQIIKQLEEMGLSVSFYQRMDSQGRKRGIRITSIDGTKYSGSSGNIVARKLLQTSLSFKQETQLNKITKRVTQLTSQLDKMLKRAQRQRRIRMKKTGEVLPKITRKNIRYTWEHYGEAEALKQITNYERRIHKLVPLHLWDEYSARVISDVAVMDNIDISYRTEWQNKTLSANVDKIGYYNEYTDLMNLLYDIESSYMNGDYNLCTSLIVQSINILNGIQ